MALSNMDKKGGSDQLKVRAITEIMKLNTLFDLQDIWRLKNPVERKYTWRQKNPAVHCRLDYFLTSSRLHDSVTKANIFPAVKTDHSAITLSMEELSSSKPGRGHWKFNATLIADPEYTNSLKLKLRGWKAETSDLESRERWEYIKFKIREQTISYSKLKIRKQKELEANLEKRLQELDGSRP